MAKQEIRVELLSDPRLLKAIRGLVREYTAGLGVPGDQVAEVVLAVDEACANAVRHSYNLKKDGQIELRLCAEPGWLEIVLRDQGIPAPVERLRRKATSAPDKETLTPGGLGVQLMYRVFDDVEFQPGETQGNCVTMRLRLSG